MPTPASQRNDRGVALVIVLAFLVLLTALVIAFFNRTMTSSRLADSSVNQLQASQLADSATGIILGDLAKEIADGSLPVTDSGIYFPRTAADFPPRRNVPTTVPDALPNLVRISKAADPISTPAVGSRASAINSTDDISLNGRSITRARWNSHYLLPLKTPGSETDTAPVDAFPSPDWVMVTSDQGPVANPADPKTIAGRYAYAIYDEGGLLDANVAGFPTATTPEQAGGKLSLAYADLRQAGSPGLPDAAVDALVGWRNYATAQPAGTFGQFTIGAAAAVNFFRAVAADATGRLTVSDTVRNDRTDQAFLNRQQLIAYARSAEWGSAMQTLQYLGTFSRDVDAPSWSPATPSGSSVDYAAKKDDPASANRAFLNVRVAGGFTRADGTQARPGDPLVKRRFPLSRLAGLGYEGVDARDKTTVADGELATATAQTIQRDFGLVWSSDHWGYCGGTGSAVVNSIKTLAEVASENREPNFFELLKAGILSGSLGKDAGDTGTYHIDWEEGPSSGLYRQDSNADVQIIRIGASIIDQFDADSFPTAIRFRDRNSGDEVECYGIEDLPYLQKVIAKTTLSWESGRTYVNGWYVAELWNPHQNFRSATEPRHTPPPAPTQFRFRGEGLTAMWTPNGPNGREDTSSALDLGASGSIDFTTQNQPLREPTMLSNDSGYVHIDGTPLSGGNGTNDAWGNKVILGLNSGRIASQSTRGGISPQNCDLILEYKAPDGSFRPYTRMSNLIGKQQDDLYTLSFFYQHVDPRTDRFGTTLGRWMYHPDGTNYGQTDPHAPGKSIRPDANKGWNSFGFFPRKSAGFIYPAMSNSSIWNNFYMGTLSDNLAGRSDPYYRDPDGIVRSAAGAYAFSPTPADTTARPLATNNAPSRPIVLNRPFRNVGELGYAFRDLPWKEIDFFSSKSGDTGLLDIFSTQETTDTRALVAGRVNLNTRQAPVLQAILAGAMVDELPPQTRLSASDAGSLAAGIVAWTADSSASKGPFANRSDLLVKGYDLFAGSRPVADRKIKMRREAAIRALADVGATRTWNLLIDVVAQTGRYAPGQTDLKKFSVSGEQRYWVHVAIDRFTGRVVDKLVEPVYE